MNKLYYNTLLLLLIFPLFNYAQSQYASKKNGLTIGVNIIDDSFTTKYKPFAIDENWNFKSPLYIGYTRSLSSKFNVHTSLTFNNYKPGKLIDGIYITDSRSYVAVDAMIQYDLSKINENWDPFNGFKPYVTMGLGYTSITSSSTSIAAERATVNYGFGVNYWFDSFENKRCHCIARKSIWSDLGVSIQAIGKSSFNQKEFGNQIQ